MPILIILAVIVAASIFYLKSKNTDDIIEWIAITAFVLSGGTFCALVFISAWIKSDYSETQEYNKLNERYKTIVYACNSDKNNIVSLTGDIAEYNSEILNGRMAMDSIWFSLYNYDFYYDLPLIELTESEEQS